MKKNLESLHPLLTLDEVAEYLNVDKFTVYRLVGQRQLPAFKVGGQWGFSQEMLVAWLLSHKSAK